MARSTMTRDQFFAIRAKQMPNDDKCKMSNYVIETNTLEGAKAQVAAICADIREKLNA